MLNSLWRKEMPIPKDKEKQYRETLEQTRERINSIESEMAQELERTKKHLQELLEEKKAMRKIYDGIALLLGIENEFEKQEKEEGEDQGLGIELGESMKSES
jgi:histidinol phosphatase-like PHP family hydrolase